MTNNEFKIISLSYDILLNYFRQHKDVLSKDNEMFMIEFRRTVNIFSRCNFGDNHEGNADKYKESL